MKSEKNKSIIHFLLLLVACAFIVKVFLYPVQVSGDSMNPTYTNGQVLFSNLFKKSDIEKNDIITFHCSELKENVIKRVVGVPGDKIKIEDGFLYVNDILIKDNFEKMKNADYIYTDVTLGKDEYFVLGDNRNNSYDSRYLGAIQKKSIISIIN